ncbi:MAG: hypothetical protein APF76_09740 [Desulfitibacter sp. BRH_c19]|nr:MAG: hypothetical protein APF76_09740 [Desulfitibacter sp. BRH_c19]
MTVGQKLHQALNSIDSAKIELKTFSMDTQDQNAKQQFINYANQLESISQGLKGRVNYAEQQEPQYKQYQSPQQQQQQQQTKQKF